MAQSARGPEPIRELTEVEWRRFIKEFKIFLVASERDGADEKVKVALFLNYIGSEALNIYDCRIGLKKETLEKVIQYFERYFVGTVNEIFERFCFRQITQNEDEMFRDFVVRLKLQAEKCSFAEKDNMIRDSIVFGVRKDSTRKELIKEKELNLARAEQIGLTADSISTKLNVMKINMETMCKKSSLNQDICELRKPHLPQVADTGPGATRSTDTRDIKKNLSTCKWCGYLHDKGKCPAFGKKCTNCGKVNHFKSVCRSNRPTFINRNIHLLNDDDSDEMTVLMGVLTLGSQCNDCWYENVLINCIPFTVKIDTGAQVNVMSQNDASLLGDIQILPTNITLEAFGGQKISPIGLIRVEIKQTNEMISTDILIVDYKTKPILGLNDSRRLSIVRSINTVAVPQSKEFDSFLNRHCSAFEGVGKIPIKHHITLKKDAKPVIRPARRIPFRLKDKLRQSLDDLVQRKIIEKVEEPTQWVNNIVIAEKKNGSLRLCLDPKFLNEAIERERSYIPTQEDIKCRLQGKSVFTVLDMKEGFYHVELSDESTKLCTFATPFGRFKFLRMPFGISSAPEVFQKIASTVFDGIEGVTVYFDDVIIAAPNSKIHDELLEVVMHRAYNWGVKFNKEKIQFKQKSVNYVGLVFSEEGVSADPKHLEAMQNMPEPKNVREVQMILGLCSYLSEFVPKLAELTAPLRKLIKKDIKWSWGTEETTAFKMLKKAVTNSPILGIFDPNKDLSMHVDASSNGLGCVLLQNERPIAYGSRSLSETEKKYAQIEKELLAVYYGCQRFHTYVYGAKIQVYTDHKPLIAIYKKELNQTTARLQRFLLGLLRYDIDLRFISGKRNLLADPLSRLYLESNELENEDIKIVHDVLIGPESSLQVTPERLKEIQEATLNDPILVKVIECYQQGWPKLVESKIDGYQSLMRYYKLRNDIVCTENLVFHNGKLVVPINLRKEIMRLLHAGHTGIEKTKAKARGLVYWPDINLHIENFVKQCPACLTHQSSQPKEPLLSHDIPLLPFNKVGIDIADVQGKPFLIVMDYYSKWIEFLALKSKTAKSVTEVLKDLFSRLGIPRTMISDNVPFNSMEFREFAQMTGIELKFTSPGYSQSNGLSEKGVGIMKRLLKKINYDFSKLWYALLEYRNTPIMDLGFSPAQLLFNRRLRTLIPSTTSLLSPKIPTGVQEKIQTSQKRQELYYNRCAVRRDPDKIKSSEFVRVKEGPVWKEKLLIGPAGTPRSYLVQGEDGKILKRNSKYIKAKSTQQEISLGPSETYTSIQDTLPEITYEGRPKRSIRVPKKLNL